MNSPQSFDWEELAMPLEWEKVSVFLEDEAKSNETDLAQDFHLNGNVNEFISLISHELRTPLTCIRGAIGLLLSGKIGSIPPQGQRMLEIALSNTDRLVRLTNVIESNPETHTKLLTAEDLERLRLGNDLRSAIADALRSNITKLVNQELSLHYQPIVDLDTGEIAGFEALTRWCNPRLGTVSPVEFIPIAEETGLINDLGIWVLRTACQQLHQWQQQVPRPSLLTMSVNVSGIQLADPEFIFQVQAALAKYPVQPTSLRLEITESVLMEDQEVTLNTLRQLQELGIKLYIDDFGTGYSSLSRLYELPLDILKIDQSFIRQEKWDLVSTLMLLAQGHKLGVIAEGVETKEQRDRLLEIGCTHAQGYLFSKPVDTIAATKLLADSAVFTVD